MTRRGYSIYKKKGKGPFYLAWTNGTGKRRVKKASDSRAVAQEIGRAKVAEADRVRGGVMSATEAKVRQAIREPVKRHTVEWEKFLRAKNRTPRYCAMQAGRVGRLLESAGVESLDGLTAEKIQEGLLRIAEKHSPNTANHYRTAVGMFCRWCVRTHRLGGSPMPAVDRLTQPGETFERYAFELDELERLYEATETRDSKCPMSGADRAMYYRLMAFTGFRRAEAASLKPESFEISKFDNSTVTVEAAYSKRRRRDVQLIPLDFAALLRPWLEGKPTGKPVFEMPRWMNLERIFERDCKAAGIEAPKGVRLGIHSLRRFYITSVVRGGGLAVGQRLARHSTPKLTAGYTDLAIHDYRKGLAGLPAASKKTDAKRRLG